MWPTAAQRPKPPQDSVLRRVRRDHFHDYTPAAFLMWLAIVLAGTAALGWALWNLDALPRWEALTVLAVLGLVALVAAFPVTIPGTAHSMVMADVFVFALLAMSGTPAAILAAGVEGLVGVLLSSKRLTSRTSAPAASMLGMAAAGAVFGPLRLLLEGMGLGHEVAGLAALCLVAPVPVVMTTVPLMTMISLKQGKLVRFADWLHASSWITAMYLASAFLAGLVYLNARQFGSALVMVATLVALGLAGLLRVILEQRDLERRTQQAKVSLAQHDAALSQQRFTAAFTHAAIGMAIVAPDGTILRANQALHCLLGLDSSDLSGQDFDQVLQADDARMLRERAAEVKEHDSLAFSVELCLSLAVSGLRWVSVHCSRYTDPAVTGQCLIYQLHDITSRRLAESRLHHIAYHDDLTDLINRHGFHERLRSAVDRNRGNPHALFAVLFLDLDRFKLVNDSLGHLAGNKLLREVANRLRHCVGTGGLVARLGGDEFAILLEPLQGVEQGTHTADLVLRALLQPAVIDGTEVMPGASIGIAYSDPAYRSVDELLRDADLAMYAAKAGGRGRIACFDSSMHEIAASKLSLESELRHAIAAGSLSLQFQPLMQLQPYAISGFEVLSRWIHPQRGPISPEVFIGLAEETGQIEALTTWVVDQSLQQLAAWHAQMPHTRHLGLNVNISGHDLSRLDLVDLVSSSLARHAVAPGHLTLEITETTLMARLDPALATLKRLRDIGVHISIDDFGTGYSSLAYLSDLPIDSLKIDRSFIAKMEAHDHNVEIVRAVLNLGRSIGRKVIAEGIETVAQFELLKQVGIDAGQGYLFSRPMHASQVQALLLDAPSAPGEFADASLDQAARSNTSTSAAVPASSRRPVSPSSMAASPP